MHSLRSSRDSRDQSPPRSLQPPSTEQEQYSQSDQARRAPQLIHDVREIENDHRERKARHSQVDPLAPPLQQSPAHHSERSNSGPKIRTQRIPRKYRQVSTRILIRGAEFSNHQNPDRRQCVCPSRTLAQYEDQSQ